MPQLVRDVMSRKVIYVTPAATIRTAMELIRSHQLEALPVMSGGRLVGVVDALDLYRFNGEFPVTEAIRADRTEIVVSPEATVVDGATAMLRHGLRQIPVVRNGELVGLLSDRDLASSWGAVPDERTGLPWQDEMRRWAARQLAAGREITVIFIDIDEFGALNKRHGHVYGDRILQLVAQACRHVVDHERDFLCRYGGDEFAIASCRSTESAYALAQQIRRAIASLQLDGRDANVSAAVGIAGGQRHVPRPGAHPSATLDDLITLASQASTRAKRSAEGIVVHLPERSEIAAPRGPAADAATAAEPPVRLVVDSYSVDRRDREVAVTVAIRARDVTHKATSLRGLDEIDLALATATADCIASFAPAHLQLRVDAIRRLAYGEHRVVMVVVTWRDPEGEEQQLVGAGLEREDAHRGVINAVLDATNRRLGYWATLRPTVPARRRRVRQRA